MIINNQHHLPSQQPTSPAVQQDISSVNQQQAASLGNEKRPLSNSNQQLISTKYERILVDNQQISYIERPQREKKAPSKYIPEDGTWQSNSRSVCEEASIAMILLAKDRHCDSAVIESKKTELANWRQMEAIDVVGDKGQKVISTKVGFNRKKSTQMEKSNQKPDLSSVVFKKKRNRFKLMHQQQQTQHYALCW